MLGVGCRPLGLGRWLLVLAVRIVSEKWTGLDFSYKGINLSLFLVQFLYELKYVFLRNQ